LAKLPETFGKYVLLERIAAGGMAEVFRAVLRGAAGFEKPVAVKRILPAFGDEPDFVTLFQDEARIASTLAHANIAQVFDFGEVDGVYYLAMELVSGVDLARLVARLRLDGQPMPLPTAAFIVAEAARGLAFAHAARAGLVHRDISPANILVSRAGEVKITDFGIAKAVGKVHKTETGVLMGKLRYMSPEQIDGRPVDGRSDVFSLGVVLYELVAGGPMFPGDPGIKLAELIRSGPVDPPSARNPAVPPELDAIILRALARDVDARTPNAGELARELTAFIRRAAPAFSREDLAALVARSVPPAPPIEAYAPTVASLSPDPRPAPRPPPAADPAPTHEPRARRPGIAMWVALAVLFVLLASATLLLLRFALPGSERPPDAASIAVVPHRVADAAVDLAPETGPFRLVGTVIGDERKALADEVDRRAVTRRGVPTPEYLAYLSAVDAKIAALTVDADGHGEADAPLPPPLAAEVGRAGVADAVAATMDYVRGTGELPPLVRVALRSFLTDRPSVAPVESMGTPPYAAAALAVWIEPTRKHLAELALANDLLRRWCETPAAPRRHFAPVLCERPALIDALRRADPRDRVAAALERWAAAQPPSESAVTGMSYRPALRPGTLEVVMRPRESGDGALTYRLVAATPDGIIDAPPSGVTPELVFTVPRRLVAPVLGIRDGATETFVQLPPPPWGGP
jgi:serine/threonine-protein kinase